MVVDTESCESIENKSTTPKCATPDELSEFEVLTLDQDDLKNEADDDPPDFETLILRLEHEYEDWIRIRKETVANLHEIADYIESVSRRTGWAKAIGSGSGALAGGLTLVGGILTIASAGAALPVLLAGTGLGIASGVGGGAAAVTEKIIKSRQMDAARKALEADKLATTHLETQLEKVRKDKVAKKVAKDALIAGGGAAYDSLKIFHLVAGSTGSSLKAGIEATAQLFGEDLGKEVSKVLLRTSGKVFSGSVTVVFGGITMAWDIYKLSNEIEELIKLGAEGANDIRTLAKELEKALLDLIEPKAEDNLNIHAETESNII